MAKLRCRFCGQWFHDVEFNEGFLEPDGKYHWITNWNGALSGETRDDTTRKRGRRPKRQNEVAESFEPRNEDSIVSEYVPDADINAGENAPCAAQ
jgi:hypothetical protein